MSKTTIQDTRIRVRPSKALLKLINDNKDEISEMPENLAKVLQHSGYSVASKVEILTEDVNFKQPQINMELLRTLCKPAEEKEKENVQFSSKETGTEHNDNDTNEVLSEAPTEVSLVLSDLRWLNVWLKKLRKEKGLDVYLHQILESCSLELPKNEVIERNPELEARCQKLREQQQNQEYLNMTKNVDASLKYIPEDTVSYQLKAINSQIIAVLQFIFSVAAGFAFGFLGIELVIGNLDFGLRLLLGIIFALVIALAEIYFLAKKLNEYDNAIDSLKQKSTPVKKVKPHSE